MLVSLGHRTCHEGTYVAKVVNPSLPAKKTTVSHGNLRMGSQRSGKKLTPIGFCHIQNQGPSHDLHILIPSLPCASGAEERPQDQECQRSPSKKSERQGRSSHVKIGIDGIDLFK